MTNNNQSPSQQIRTIHVGASARGKVHLDCMVNDPRFRPVAAVDVRNEAFDHAVENCGVPRAACFSNLTEALQSVEADAVVISTPVVFHGEQIEQALESGRHVMVEKPFTVDLQQAERIVATAANRNLKVMVTQNMRYFPELYTLARLVREQVYGKAGFFQLMLHKARSQPYHNSPHQQLWQMSVHEFDLIRSVFGSSPNRVYCKEINPPWTIYPTAPTAIVTLEFEGGLTGSYIGSSDSKTRTYEFRVECENGALINRPYLGPLYLARGAEETQLDVDPLPGAPDADSMMTHLFYEYLAHDIEPDISGRNNLGTLRLVDACIRSAETHEIVTIA